MALNKRQVWVTQKFLNRWLRIPVMQFDSFVVEGVGCYNVVVVPNVHVSGDEFHVYYSLGNYMSDIARYPGIWKILDDLLVKLPGTGSELVVRIDSIQEVVSRVEPHCIGETWRMGQDDMVTYLRSMQDGWYRNLHVLQVVAASFSDREMPKFYVGRGMSSMAHQALSCGSATKARAKLVKSLDYLPKKPGHVRLDSFLRQLVMPRRWVYTVDGMGGP
jgi:hypothetical protein